MDVCVSGVSVGVSVRILRWSVGVGFVVPILSGCLGMGVCSIVRVLSRCLDVGVGVGVGLIVGILSGL